MIRYFCVMSSALVLLFAALPGPSYSAEPGEEADQAKQAEDKQAEDKQAEEETGIEVITVTGSHVRRKSFEGPSPVQQITSDDFDVAGLQQTSDVLKLIPANTGSEFNADAFTQNATTGTAQVNLRNLGLNSTLVLLNGRRVVPSPGAPNDGANFVDINNFPLAMIERIDIVKDGAAALYGSDAVAGVVNFITRKDFEGLEFDGNYQTTTRGGQTDASVSLVFGVGGDRAHFIGQVGYLTRSPLDFAERDFPAGTGTSGLGQPGSFIPLAPNPGGFAPGQMAADPACGAPGSLSGVVPGFAGAPGGTACTFDFIPFYQFVAREERINGFSSFDYELADTIDFYSEFAFNRNRADRTVSPSFPMLAFPMIPGNNPGNPTASALGAGDGAPVIFFGRALGAAAGPEKNHVRSNTYRFVNGIKGNLIDTLSSLTGVAGDGYRIKKVPSLFEDWDWDASYIFSESQGRIQAADTLAQNFSFAINGLGGKSCNRAGGAAAGDPGCLWFNPFGSSIGAAPTSPAYNDPAVLDYLVGHTDVTIENQLQVVDLLVNGSLADFGELLDLGGDNLGFAVGYQFRKESLDINADDLSNADSFLFVVGTPDKKADRDINAVFGEVVIPPISGTELQVAVRWERYSDTGGSTEPKVALSLVPFDLPGVPEGPDFLVKTRLRGSFSQSFRAPSLFQQNATQTVLEQISDPLNPGTPIFRAIRTQGNQSLDNEDSTAWSGGISLKPLEGMEFTLDYWNFEYTDVITKESSQAVVNADPSGPKVIRDPATNAITMVLSDFINAAGVDSDGLDFRATYLVYLEDWLKSSMELGHLLFTLDTTWVRSFDIKTTPGGPTIDGVGSRNFTNFARSIPEWRVNFSLTWGWRDLSLTNSVRYTDSYTNDEPTPHVGIDSFTSWDITASYVLDDIIGQSTTLQLGLINVLDRDPPFVQTNGGYDSKVHDPRGRLFYAGIKQNF